jgi:hypothetical protein
VKLDPAKVAPHICKKPLAWFIRCNGSVAGAAFPANDSFYFDPGPVLATLLA